MDGEKSELRRYLELERVIQEAVAMQKECLAAANAEFKRLHRDKVLKIYGAELCAASFRKTWQYSLQVEQMEADLRRARAREQKTGAAIAVSPRPDPKKDKLFRISRLEPGAEEG